MKPLLITILSFTVASLTGCVSPLVPMGETSFYQRTDPHAFFLDQQRQGNLYYIGIRMPEHHDKVVVPGVPQADPYVKFFTIWSTGVPSQTNQAANKDFLQAAEPFLHRYNQEVYAYAKQHPEQSVLVPVAEYPATRENEKKIKARVVALFQAHQIEVVSWSGDPKMVVTARAFQAGQARQVLARAVLDEGLGLQLYQRNAKGEIVEATPAAILATKPHLLTRQSLTKRSSEQRLAVGPVL